MKKYILIVLISIFVFGCSSKNNNSNTTVIASTLIAKDNLFGAGAEGITEQNLIISNQTAWNNLITQMNSVNNVSDSFTETNINFNEYTIIAIFDQIRANGGYSIELSITRDSEHIVVNINKIVPEGNATTVITQPFNITKIQNSDFPIIFE